MNILIYDRHSIDQVPWPATLEGAYARSLLGPLIRHGPQRLIDNADAEVRVLIAGDLVLPLVLGNSAPPVKKEGGNVHCFVTADALQIRCRGLHCVGSGRGARGVSL
jgi:hypothetical protein